MRYQLYRTKKADGTPHPKWRIKFFRDDGSYHSQETGLADKRLTEARAKNRLQELERDRHNEAMGLSAAPQTRIQDVIAAYVKAKDAFGGRSKRGWTEESRYKAVSSFEWWTSRMGWKTIGDVRLKEVEAALAEYKAEGMADNTLDARRNHIKALTRWATDREILIRDPLRALKRGTIVRKVLFRDLKPAELVATLETAEGHDYLYMKGGAVSGLRAQELARLKVEMMDWEKGANLPADLIGNKAKKAVLVRMPKDYLAELRAFCAGKAPGDYIFRPAVYMNAARLLQRYTEAAGIPQHTKAGNIVFHSLRHSFVSMINSLNPDLKTRMNLSRHEDLDVNLGYSHEEEEAGERTIEALSAKLRSHIGVTRMTWTPGSPINKGWEAKGKGICTSFSSDKSPLSQSESFNSLENRQLHLKGGTRLGQPGRGLKSQGRNIASQLEDIWALVTDADRQSIVNHARGLLLGLKIHRKAVG